MRIYTDLSTTHPDLNLELCQLQGTAGGGGGNLDICDVNQLDPSHFMTPNEGKLSSGTGMAGAVNVELAPPIST